MQIEAVRLNITNLAFTNFVVFLCYKNIVLDDEESEMSWKKTIELEFIRSRIATAVRVKSISIKIYFDSFGGSSIEIHIFKSHQNAIEWKHVGLQFIVQIMGNLWTYFAVQSHLMSSYQPNVKTVCITLLCRFGFFVRQRDASKILAYARHSSTVWDYGTMKGNTA